MFWTFKLFSYKKLLAQLKSSFKDLIDRNGTEGSASVEFILLAIPLFLPILIFLGHFSQLSNAELLSRNLVRESLRAFVTSPNVVYPGARAESVLYASARAAGLSQQEINSIDLKFECSKFPCISRDGHVKATLTMELGEQKRKVVASADEYISPWQWNWNIPRV